jgi:hypothetical protein
LPTVWDFETDPEYQAKLDWVEKFMVDELEPLDLVKTRLGGGRIYHAMRTIALARSAFDMSSETPQSTARVAQPRAW